MASKEISFTTLKDKKYLTMKEACYLLSISRQKLSDFIKEGNLKVIRIGRAIRIPQEEIDKLSK